MSNIVKEIFITGIEKVKLQEVVLYNINYAIQYTGTTKNVDVKEFEVVELTKEILNNFRNLRVDEISIAFKNGLNNEYGEFFGLNVKTYVQWIKVYYNSEKRHATIFNKHHIQLPMKTEPTNEELEKIFIDALEFSKNHFQKTGEILDKGNAIFRGLWKRKLLNLNQEQVQQYRDDAYWLLNSELNDSFEKAKHEHDRGQVTQIKKQIDELESGMSDSVKMIAGNLALKDYFKTL